MYYRRWTRMHLKPGMKYFMKYGVISPEFDRYSYLMNLQNPDPIQYRTRKVIPNTDRDLDTKLINSLFLKYPDLKYEPISHNTYPGRQLNTFSYAYSFINEQKKLIKQGHSIASAFKITEEKYHEKMQRKLDQSLLSRGLAMSNRARSFMNVYQQQSEYESRLKTQRSQRELEKYQMKLQAIREAAQSDTGAESILTKDTLDHERIFYEIYENKKDPNYSGAMQEVGHTEIAKIDGKERSQFLAKVEGRFKNLFDRFYEHAAAKDRLDGLTDDEIISQIQSSPSKIKRRMKDVAKFFQSRNIKVSLSNGKIVVSGQNSHLISDDLKNNKYLKIALLEESLNYQKPIYSTTENILMNGQSIKKIFKNRATFKQERPQAYTKQDKDVIKQNKKKELDLVIDQQLFYHKEAYKVFQTEEERLLRLQIKYYDKLINQIVQNSPKKATIQDKKDQLNAQIAKNTSESAVADPKIQKKVENENDLEALQEKRKEAIASFRRLKFRLQKRYRDISADNFLFPEHEQMEKKMRYEDEVEYEDLIGYLRKKTEDRRLTSLDQSKDNKISKAIRIVKLAEGVIAEGTVNEKTE